MKHDTMPQSRGRLAAPTTTVTKRRTLRLVSLATKISTLLLAVLASFSATWIEAAAPVISGTSALTLQEDAGATNLVYIITDSDTPVFSITTWATSSNQGLVSSNNIKITGLSRNRQLTLTPTANSNGVATITFFASDGTSTNSLALALRVDSVNDAPSFHLSTNTVTVLEDALAVTNAAFATLISAGPPNESSQTLSFSLTAQTTSDTNKFSTQPAISPTGILTFKPATNANGSAIFSVVLRDSGPTTNSGVNVSTSTNLTINITAVNDRPVMTITTNIVMNEDSSTNVVLNVIDVDSSFSSLTVSNIWFTSTDATLIVPTNVVVTRNATNFTLGITPAANFFGTNTLKVVVDDGGTNNNRATNSIVIIVRPVNDIPDITISANAFTILEDAALQTVSGFITSTNLGVNESSQSITNFIFTASPTNGFRTQPSISSVGALVYQPATNFNGAISLTVKAQDNGGTNFGGVNISTAKSFTITVTAVNDATTVTMTTPVIFLEDHSSTNTIILADVDTAITNITQTATSSDTVTIPNANLIFSGTGTNRTLVITPVTNLNSAAPINITIITDDHGTANNTTTNVIAVTVTAVNDPPTFHLASATVSPTKFAISQVVSNFLTSISSGPTNEASQTVTMSLTAATTSLFSAQPAVNTNGTLSYTIANGASGESVVSVIAVDTGGTANGGLDRSTNTFSVVIPPNPFKFLSGDFHGLFYRTNGVEYTNSGSLKFTVNTNGVITTGSVAIAGKSYSITNAAGQFNIDTSNPTATFSIDRSADSQGNLNFSVAVDASSNWTESFDGTVGATNWSSGAVLLGNHAYKDTYTYKVDGFTSMDAGNFTLVFPGTGPTNAPSGDGYGTAVVSTNGTVILSGKLPDGELLAQTNSVSVSGNWPLYVNLYTNGTGGTLLGWVNFTATSSNDLSGAMSWVKNQDLTQTNNLGVSTNYFYDGFVNFSTLEGSTYIAPATGDTILALATGTIEFGTAWATNSAWGWTNAPITDTFPFPAAPTTTVTVSTNALTALSFTYGTGFVTGTFDYNGGTNNVSPVSLTFEGVVLQKSSTARGFFLNPSAAPFPSGSMLVH